MFLAGLISTALVLAGSMANDWTINGQHSAWWNISRYGLMPTIYIFIGIAVIGMALVAWGLFDKKNWAANSSLYIPANPYHSRRKGVLHEVAGRLFSWQTYHNDMQRYSLAKPYDPVRKELTDILFSCERNSPTGSCCALFARSETSSITACIPALWICRTITQPHQQKIPFFHISRKEM